MRCLPVAGEGFTSMPSAEQLAESATEFLRYRATTLLNLMPRGAFAQAREGEAAKPENATENVKKISGALPNLAAAAAAEDHVAQKRAQHMIIYIMTIQGMREKSAIKASDRKKVDATGALSVPHWRVVAL